MSEQDGRRRGAIGTLTRWGWRYRSELAPCYVAAALFIAGTAAHLHTPGWLAVLPTLAALAAGALILWGAKVGLDRPVERAYAATVVGLSGLWLWSAALFGPLHPWLWRTLLAGWAVLGLPWWVHRRRRAKVRVVRAVGRWAADAAHAGLAGTRLQRVEVDPEGGWHARVLLRPGQTLEDVQPRVRALESALDLRRGAIEAAPDPAKARRVVLRVAERNPLAGTQHWPGPPANPSIVQPVMLGRYQDGRPCTVPLAGQHALVAGATGSGKSSLLDILVGTLAACPDVVLWGCDLKYGLELGPWRPVLGQVATTAPQAAELLAAAERVMQARGEHLAAMGLDTWPVTSELPALVVVVDEHRELGAAPEAIASVERLTAKGRALAVSVISATQYPTVEALGSSHIAPQMTVKVCLRVASSREVNVILGPGAASAGYAAHQIRADQPGAFYLHALGATSPRLARAFHLSDQHRRQLANRYGRARPELDPPSAHAATSQPDPTAALRPERDDAGAAADPEQVLYELLAGAGPEGLPIAVLLEQLHARAGMRRTWVYDRLANLERAGQVRRLARGRWQLTPPADPPEEPRS